MKRDRFNDYVMGTANKLRKDRKTLGKGPRNPIDQGDRYLEPFHAGSFVRGAEFAYNLLQQPRTKSIT